MRELQQADWKTGKGEISILAIIDYDAGNLRSVENALRRLGHRSVITRDPAVILQADHIILPGVGAFGDAMKLLEKYDLPAVLREAVSRDIPLLGICLGLQLLFEESEESPGVKGLGFLEGCIRRIPGGGERKVPHMGWNDLTFPRAGELFAGLSEGTFVYFVHSYYLQAADSSIVTAQTEYGVTIDAAVQQERLFACQFHPEKSGEAGLQILTNFLAAK